MVPGRVDPRRLLVVLVDPQHEGNLGSGARALGNLGIGTLRLVRGVEPGEEAARLACGSRDILDEAARFDSLADALADCALAVGFVSPERRRELPVVPLPDAIPRVVAATTRDGRVALVFGREDRGLTAEEADRCGILASIPLPSERPTLNVAQAVLLAGYEIVRPFAVESGPVPPLPAPGAHRPGARLATIAEREGAAAAIDDALVRLGLDEVPRARLRERIASRLRAIHERAVLDLYDVRMIRGLAARVMRVVPRKAGEKVPRLTDEELTRDENWPEQL